MEETKYLKRLRDRLETGQSRLFLSLAEELWKRERDDEAFSVMQKGIEEDPSFCHARVILAMRLMDRGLYSRAEREIAAAAALYEGMLAETPGEESLAQARENLLSLLRKAKKAKKLETFLEGIKARFKGQA